MFELISSALCISAQKDEDSVVENIFKNEDYLTCYKDCDTGNRVWSTNILRANVQLKGGFIS